MADLKELLESRKWKVSFDNPELQERLGNKIDYWEAELLQTACKIILFSPLISKSLEFDFSLNLYQIPNGYSNGYSIDIFIKPEGMIINSEEYGIVRMVEYSM